MYLGNQNSLLAESIKRMTKTAENTNNIMNQISSFISTLSKPVPALAIQSDIPNIGGGMSVERSRNDMTPWVNVIKKGTEPIAAALAIMLEIVQGHPGIILNNKGPLGEAALDEKEEEAIDKAAKEKEQSGLQKAISSIVGFFTKDDSEKDLEDKRLKEKATKIEEKKVGILEGIWENTKAKGKGIWDWIKNNWGLLLLGIALLLTPLELIFKVIQEFMNMPFWAKALTALGATAAVALAPGVAAVAATVAAKKLWTSGKNILGFGGKGDKSIKPRPTRAIKVPPALHQKALLENKVRNAHIKANEENKARKISKAHTEANKINNKKNALQSKIKTMGGPLKELPMKKESGLFKNIGKVGKVAGRLFGKLFVPLTVGMAVLDTGSGVANAGEILGKEGPLTFRDRVAGGVGGVLDGLTVGMLNKEKIAKKIAAAPEEAIKKIPKVLNTSQKKSDILNAVTKESQQLKNMVDHHMVITNNYDNSQNQAGSSETTLVTQPSAIHIISPPTTTFNTGNTQ